MPARSLHDGTHPTRSTTPWSAHESPAGPDSDTPAGRVRICGRRRAPLERDDRAVAKAIVTRATDEEQERSSGDVWPRARAASLLLSDSSHRPHYRRRRDRGCIGDGAELCGRGCQAPAAPQERQQPLIGSRRVSTALAAGRLSLTPASESPTTAPAQMSGSPQHRQWNSSGGGPAWCVCLAIYRRTNTRTWSRRRIVPRPRTRGARR
jgi:hypothetical protein